ncbi:hypothetical protein [Saccharicrinis sp. 156]|uniref:hypothetical protein n=1 Tax=Saccharicrinis sp. 156 TaxID=3417574 RepID=UPI003D339176
MENNILQIEHNQRKNSYDISQINNLKIKLRGFDGQPFHKSMEYLRPQAMRDKKLVTGLDNYVKFNYEKNNYKFELYFDNEKDYE